MQRSVVCRRALLVSGAALPLLPAAGAAQQTATSPGRRVAEPAHPFRGALRRGRQQRRHGPDVRRTDRRAARPAVVVENRSGATGAIGTEAVIRSRPDGYTLLIGSPGSIVNGPLLMAAPRYDPIVDLAPVALLGQVPMAITVRPETPARGLGELVAHSKARPGA
jgi:hypothetical protein